MLIHEDHNGVVVNAISSDDGVNVEGHQYQISVGSVNVLIDFQFGPVPDNGVNGVTNESLLVILAHRINHLNKTFPCRENSLAITKIEEALHWLEARTSDRITRGVEGKGVL